MRELDGRYARQGRLAQMGADGQRRLRDGVAVVIGCGALGTAAAELLV
ncbi:MAG: ThiF family adenylyltransferase, partial [Planctomycetota bacterium]